MGAATQTFAPGGKHRRDATELEVRFHPPIVTLISFSWMLTGVEQIVTDAHRKNYNLACTDILKSPDCIPKIGQSHLLYGKNCPPKKVDVYRNFQAS